MTKVLALGFSDGGTFEENAAAFSSHVIQLDADLGPILSGSLGTLASEKQDKAALLTGLFKGLQAAALSTSPSDDTVPPVTVSMVAPTPAPVVQTAEPRWFLDQIEIEGFRGINNEGAPLVLKFKSDSINSVSAPNGVGKSSIYDALSFALTGGIPKIDRLLVSERDKDYYLNLFHPGTTGSVKLVLRPDQGGKTVPITVTRDELGSRIVSGPAGFDAESLLRDLSREFVLLDAQTFQSFIDVKALDRGRAFSGLLGLARYSALRQQLQALANTRSFNSHFETAAHSVTKSHADVARRTAHSALARDFADLVKEPFDVTMKVEDAQQKCANALAGIPVLSELCNGIAFPTIDIAACVECIKTAEGGSQRQRHGEVLKEQDTWTRANRALPSEEDAATLIGLATTRESALALTSGSLLNELYRSSERVLQSDAWSSPEICPTCGHEHDAPVLDIVHAKLEQYDAVETATVSLGAEWVAKGWSQLSDLEALARGEGEATNLSLKTKAGEAGALLSAEATELPGR